MLVRGRPASRGGMLVREICCENFTTSSCEHSSKGFLPDAKPYAPYSGLNHACLRQALQDIAEFPLLSMQTRGFADLGAPTTVGRLTELVRSAGL